MRTKQLSTLKVDAIQERFVFPTTAISRIVCERDLCGSYGPAAGEVRLDGCPLLNLLPRYYVRHARDGAHARTRI
jgi:hypothetical protein